jgi:mono/diheme cytochrome c family protein
MKQLRVVAPLLGLVAGFVPMSGACAADAARGKDIYIKVGCYGCHGYDAQGASTGPKLAPDPMPPDALASFIRNSAPTLMPPYSEKVLGDAEVADIHAYLATIKKPPRLKEIPLLSSP